MPKIVHITTVHSADDIRIYYKQCISLASAGYDVVLIAPRSQFVEKGLVRIHYIPLPSNRLTRMTVTAFIAFRAALAERGDIYHIHDPELLPVGQILRLLRKTVVYDMHENTPKALLYKEWIPPSLRSYASLMYRVTEKCLMFGLPVVFAERSYERDYPWVSQHVNILNLPLICDLQGIYTKKASVFTLGYLGAVGPGRGTLVTLEAIRILRDRGHKIYWDCVGPVQDAHRAEIEALAKRYELEGIRLHGYLPPRQGWEIMAHCSAGLAVLQPLPNYVDSVPTKIFEYMALGIPVLASDFPIYRDIVETHGVGLCVAPTPESLADGVEEIIRDPKKADLMSLRGRETVVGLFSWDSEAAKLRDLYRDLTQ
ncbi:MAG: glycosyltransferase [Deltaproteobacteria bacterium]|nr:glycosyltransferase [Deltaproteobacteria bacterium]